MRNGVGDARTRTNQAEPKTGKAIYEDESFRGSEVQSLKDGGFRGPQRERGKLTKRNRVAVEAGLSVGRALQTQVRVRMRRSQGPARQFMKMKVPGVMKSGLSKMSASELCKGIEAC